MDHFVFYLKINSERQDVVTYPAKRYSVEIDLFRSFNICIQN